MVLVTPQNIDLCIKKICDAPYFSFDTETTGLYSYLGDRLFCLVIATPEHTFYFNFHVAGQAPEPALPLSFGEKIQPCFSNSQQVVFAQNAKFDMHMLWNTLGISVENIVHCTQAGARVQKNNRKSYSLQNLAHLVGGKKDSRVEEWIKKNKSHVKIIDVFGDVNKKPDYTQVPFDLIAPYAAMDAELTLKLGLWQVEQVRFQSSTQQKNLAQPVAVLKQERLITKICFEMERVGIKVDVGYCYRAIAHEEKSIELCLATFRNLTGEEFVDSAKALVPHLVKFGDPIGKTLKGRDSVSEESLSHMKSPIATLVKEYRGAAKRVSTYYKNFVRFADDLGNIHPSMKQAGTVTGRFSYTEPNLQNLSKEEDTTQEFLIRRAFVPRTEYCFVMIDYDQMEYRLMLDYAGEHGLIDSVKSGVDVHQATADLMKVSRREAKTINFMLLYGGGNQTLANALDVPLHEAEKIKNLYFEKLPAIELWSKKVIQQVEMRHSLTNWLGRIYSYDNPYKEAYKGPNHLIQGGCADIVKKAMVDLQSFLENKKSRMLVQVHDEIVFEIHDSEHSVILELKKIMENAYASKHLPLTCGIDHSYKSWADKIKGIPLDKRRDEI